MAGRYREALMEKFLHGWSSLVCAQIMEGEGYTDVEDDVVRSDRVPQTRGAVAANGMVAIFLWARLLSRRGVSGSLSVGELDGLEMRFERDVRSGCYVVYGIHVALGFKAE